jgi:hypothetical protein
MKLLALLPIITLTSCATTYTYKLAEPVESNSLSMENDTMKISFSMAPKKVKQIDFHLENKLNTPMKVIWDDASVSVMGSTYKIINGNTKFRNSDRAMPPTNIAAKQYVDEVVSPSVNIKMKCEGKVRKECHYVVDPFLPVYHEPKFEDGWFVVLLPVEINKAVYNMSFKISAKVPAKTK